MMFEKYDAYKDSGVDWIGEIPNHWCVEKSKWLFSLRKEKALKNEEQLTASQKYGMIPQNEFMALEGRRVTQVEFNSEILKHVEKGDFVISMRSFQGGLEYSEYTGSVSSAYVALKPITGIFSLFFKYLFKSQRYIEALQSTSNLVRDGQALRYDNFCMVDLFLPPIEEQMKIANFLNQRIIDIDQAISIKEQQIALLNERKQIIIQKAVTQGLDPNVSMKDSGVEWIGQIPEHWVILPLTKYSTRVDYRGKTPEKVEEGRLLVTTRNIKNGVLDYQISQEYIKESQYKDVMSRGLPQIGDILFTMEAPLGHSAIVDREDIAIAQRIIKFRLNPEMLNSYFVNFYFQTDIFQNYLYSLGTGSTALGIKASKLGILKLIAPNLDEQGKIVEFLKLEEKKFNSAFELVQQQIEKLKEYKTTLINDAVTGKIKVA
ncbi:restriction endonuclease subunit S [Acinetobacter junii]|uniref:Restriction endonuclease subunit S n=1 Tax=Acinetobacter junii TaxID=40215 RepID=A0ABU8ZHG5_ACIJU